MTDTLATAEPNTVLLFFYNCKEPFAELFDTVEQAQEWLADYIRNDLWYGSINNDPPIPENATDEQVIQNYFETFRQYHTHQCMFLKKHTPEEKKGWGLLGSFSP